MIDKKIVEKALSIPNTFEEDFKDLKNNKHTHTNSDVINGITQEKVASWDKLVSGPPMHEHSNLETLNKISEAHVTSLNNLQTNLDKKAEVVHTHSEYVTSSPGKQLSTNDFTNNFKTQLEKIKAFDGTYNSITGTPDLSQYTNEAKVNELITHKTQVIDQSIQDLNSKKHTHTNTDALNMVTVEKIRQWDEGCTGQVPDPSRHEHKNLNELNQINMTHITALNNLQTNLDKKADKQHTHNNYVVTSPGKQLSTNDFTTIYKEKLDSLESFDGTYGSLKGSPDLNQYTNEAKVNELITGKMKPHETDFNELKRLKHSHSNATALNSITESKIQSWDKMASTPQQTHEHKNLAVLNQISPVHITSLNNLQTNLDKKADKEHVHSNYVTTSPGKQLSTNDFTDIYKTQLDGIKGFNGSYSSITGTPDLSQYTNTTTVNQLIDAKLKSHTVDLSGYVKLEKYNVDMLKKADKEHTHNTYRLISDSYSKTEVEDLLGRKADSGHIHTDYVTKEARKGLSTNDFTDEYKLKLDNMNEISSIEASKVVEDSTHKFVTDVQIADWTKKAGTEYVDSKTAEVSSTLTSYITTQLNTCVKKDGSKVLSTNDYTTTEKNKLAGIADKANNYVHPSSHNATEITVTGGKTLQQAIDDGEIGGSSGGGIGIIFDANSKKTGEGQIQSDLYADSGRSLTLTSNTEKLIAFFKADKSKLGKYGLALRAKSNNNTLNKAIVKIQVLKVAKNGGESQIKTIEFTGTDFERANSYCWLTSFFDYSLQKNEGDELGIKVFVANSGTSVKIDFDYLNISPLMSAQFVMG